MAWYVDLNGRQVWVEAEDTVYTVLSASDDLPVIPLKYLVTTTKKASYAEHAIDDDIETGGKKKKEMAGRQRGYIVRMEERGEALFHVKEFFQEVAGKLLSSGVVSRIDADESSGERKRRRKKKAEESVGAEAEGEEPQIALQHIDLDSMACNELRVLITARCRHDAHGVGFRIEVAEGRSVQALHMFTSKQELTLDDWSAHLTEVIRKSGAIVMDARVPPAALPTDEKGHTLEGGAKNKKDEAQLDEEDWLSSMMGRCMVEKKKESVAKEGSEAKTEDGPMQEGTEKSKPAPAGDLPPWLRTRRARKKDASDEAQ